MNVVLLPQEKTVESSRDVESVHAAVSDVPDAKVVAVLLEVAEHEEQKRRIIEKSRQFLLTVGYVGVGLYLSLLFIINSLWMNMGILFVLLVPHVINYLYGTSSYSHIKRLHDVVIDLLKLPNQPHLILPLVDCLNASQGLAPKRHSLIASALTECLWNQTAPDAALSLDETRCATLRNWLRHPYFLVAWGKSKVHIPGHFDELNTDLAVAIMKTLAGMGDPKTVKVLQKIIKAEAVTPNESVVRDAAREYLPVLVQKMAKNSKVRSELRRRANDQTRNPRRAVAELVDTLPAEEAKALLVDFFRTEQTNNAWWPILIVTAVQAVLFSFAPFHGVPLSMMRLFSLFVFVVCNLLFWAMFSPRFGYNSASCKIVHELSRRTKEDVRLLPYLLQATRIGLNRNQANDVKKALTRLLPLLKPGDAALISSPQRATLRSWLKLPRNKKKAVSSSDTLTIAALDALSALGDTKALPAAEKIARRTANGVYHETELHKAAVRCVESLVGRRNRSTIGGTTP